jgi:DNA repair protein SbcD/Mre11
VTTPNDGRLGTILHAADLHLGAPLKSLGETLPAEAVSGIMERAVRAWDNLVDLALAERVDVVVLAGDVYDTADYEVRAQIRFADGLDRLTQAGVRVFVAHGNHDPRLEGMKPAAALPTGVTVFGADEPQLHAVELASGHLLHVAGVSFGTPAETANLARRFHGLSTPVASTLGVLHANVGSIAGHDPYAPCTPDDLQLAPVGYWALGHIHLRQHHPLGAGRWWAYSGNLQGRSTKASECGPKGVLLVPVFDSGFGEPEFRRCADVQFERVPVDVSGCGDLGAAIDVVEQRLDGVFAEAGVGTLVARIRLTGRADAHGQLVDARNAGTLLEALHHRLGTAGPVAVVRVEVATRSSFDREQALRRDNLLGALLTRFDELSSLADGGARRPDVLGGLFADNPVAQARLDALLNSSPEVVGEVLDQAEQLLIDHLEEAS